MEPFDIRLDGEEIEASPDFDDLPANSPNKKICQPILPIKRFASENQQRKKKGLLDKKNSRFLSLDELASFCLNKVLTLSSICITLSPVIIGSKHKGIR